MAGIERTRWQAVSPLLDELLEAGAAQREARLAQIRRQDRALADDVAALLAREAAVETAQFLEGSALEATGAASLAGRTIGSYTLERPLGQGGMGAVWLARRSDGRFEGRAAVKFLNLALLARGGAERFRREGSMLAKLAHPNIARLIDAGVDGGQPYLVLEYVDGLPIDRWCDARSLGVEARIRLFLDVAAAVAHAHGKLILHRDLKPSNILVTADGHVKLLDFGIAKLIEDPEQAAPPTELTQAAGRAFTPEYAAPEQVQGGEATLATDVYALGVLLHVLLAGAHPTAVSAGAPMAQLRALVETELPRLSDSALRAGAAPQLVRALRGDLDNIVARAAKKAPAERYPTVDALADDLARHLKHEPVSARPDSLAYRVGKFVRRHRIGVGAASATVLALLAGIVGTAWQAVEASRARDMMVAQWQRAEATNRLLSVVLSEVSPGGASFTPGELLAHAERWAGRLYAQDPRLHAEMLMVLGDRIDHTDGERALNWYQAALTLAQPLGDPELSAAAACRVAVKLAITGADVARANRMIESALRSIADRPPGNVARVRCLINANYAAAEAGDADAALVFAERAVAEAERGAGPPLDRLAGPVAVLASAYTAAGRYADAQRQHERGLAILRDSGLAESVRSATALNNAAVNLLLAGATKEALIMLAQTIALDRSAGTGGYSTANTAANYAAALLQVGRTDEAVRWAERAIEEARRQKNATALGRALLVASRARQQAGDLPRAEEALREAAATIAATLAPRHIAHAAVRTQQGALALARADLQRGRDLLLEAVAMYEAHAPRASDRAFALVALADAHRRRGEFAPALARSEEALALARAAAGGFPYSYRVGLAALAACEARQAGGFAGAERSCDLAVSQLLAAVGDDAPATRQARAMLDKVQASPVRSYFRVVEFEAALRFGRALRAQGDAAGARAVHTGHRELGEHFTAPLKALQARLAAAD
jgi:serine/threonine-protein kinase